jgi:hypothetical protein
MPTAIKDHPRVAVVTGGSGGIGGETEGPTVSDRTTENLNRLSNDVFNTVTAAKVETTTEKVDPAEASVIAAATLHVVDAYRVIETLSCTSFSRSLPYSFEFAWQCICAALVALDECSATFDL